MKHPLSPLAISTYLKRNAGKTVPMAGVIVLAVMLVIGIVTLMNSIPHSIRTIYRYSQRYVGLTPRGDANLTPRLKEAIESSSPVALGRVMVCRGSDTQVRSIVGKWPFVVLALSQDDLRFYLDRMESTKLQGRLPNVGAAEAVISEPVARNLNLKLGDALLKPDDTDAYSPNEVRIVGVAKTEQWLMLTSLEYHRRFHYPPIDVLLVFAKNPAEQPKLDAWCETRFKGERARVYTFAQLEKDTDEMFKILFKILNVVIGTLVVVITIMMGMLANIFLTQRTQEFGLLQAIGHTKAALLRRVIGESVTIIVGGWLLGLGFAILLLNLVKVLLMDPNAFALDVFDPLALAYTIPVPVAIIAVTVLTVLVRFRRFDPVSVVERRLV